MRNSILILCILFSISVYSQSDSTEQRLTFAEKFEFGGSLGIDPFGTSALSVSLSPVGIYHLHTRVHLGGRLNFTYTKDLVSTNDNIRYGGSAFLRGIVSDSFYGQVEFEELNVYTPTLSRPRTWRSIIMVGAGYKHKVNVINTFFTTMLILNYNSNTPYSSFYIVRAGATVLLSDIKGN